MKTTGSSKKNIVDGFAVGTVLKTTNPINFLAAVDKKTGVIRDKKYDIFGKSIKDTVLVFPHGIGSSVGAYTIYSLESKQSAPVAMICTKADLTVASGCALANIPMIVVSNEEFDFIENGTRVEIDTYHLQTILYNPAENERWTETSGWHGPPDHIKEA